MFGLQVGAPLDGVFEGFAGGLEGADGFGVGHALEVGGGDGFQGGYQFFIVEAVEKGEVVGAVGEDGGENIAEEVLGEGGEFVQVAEGDFGFYHPEFGQVAGGVGVFGAEGGAEGVDVGHCLGEYFGFQLAADGEVGGAAKEVGGVVDGAAGGGGQAVEVEGGDAEHCAGALGIAGGDDGGLEVEEAAPLEELVDGECHRVADAGDGAEGVSAGAQVGVFAEELQGVAFLLQRVVFGVGGAEEFQGSGGDFVALAASGGFLEASGGADAATGVEAADEGVVGGGGVKDDLEVGEGGAVVDVDEGDAAGGADGFDPAFDGGISAGGGGGEEVFDAGAAAGSGGGGGHSAPP